MDHYAVSSFSSTQPLPRSTLFPYTTLFRSVPEKDAAEHRKYDRERCHYSGEHVARIRRPRAHHRGAAITRSEEHTSELQSRGHLVCRLLLEKKNACLNARRS